MRIGINTRFLLRNGLEGIGVYTQELSKRLAENYPEHEWYFFFDREFDEKFITSSNITPIIVPPPARHPILWHVWFEISLPFFLKKNKIDFFFSPDSYSSLSTDIPQLLTVHDLAFEYYPETTPWLVNKYYRKYFPKYCQKANHIIAISNQTKNDLIELYNISNQKISVLPNGVSDDFRPRDKNTIALTRTIYTAGKPYFLYVGAIHPRKNVLSLLQAFNKFKTDHPDLPHQLLIVGRNAWGNEELFSYHKKMTHKTEVVWLNNISQSELIKITASSTAMVYISLYEGFGLPVLESMACGRCVITSAASPMSDIVGEAGVVVPPTDIDMISSKMFLLASNHSLREQLNEKSLLRSKNYHWDITAQKTGKLIMQQISSNI